MRRASVLLMLGAMLLWAEAAAADSHHLNHLNHFNKFLHGDYASTGEASCLVAIDGFDSDLVPISTDRFVVSFSAQGVVTFNGDGTGTRYGRSMSIAHSDHPLFRGSAGSDDWQASFTYTVTSESTFTTELSGPLTGTILTGSGAGLTYTIDQIPLTGTISADKKTLTLATDVPTVETQTFSNGNIRYRICHRSRVLFRLKNDNKPED